MCVCVCVCACVCMVSSFSRVQLFETSWTVAHQAPLSMGFSRQEYWSGLPFTSAGDLSDPGMEPMSPVSPASQENSLPTELPGKPTYTHTHRHTHTTHTCIYTHTHIHMHIYTYSNLYTYTFGFPGGSVGNESACNAGDLGSIPGLGSSSGEGNGYSLQNSCLENPMDRGVWQAIVHGVIRVVHNSATKVPPYICTYM